MRRKTCQRKLLFLCALAVLVCGQGGSFLRACAAAPKTLGMAQANTLALSNNSDYRKAKSKLTLQDIKYRQALKAIALKKKNKETFRWTPLLSFKFPEKANLTEEADYLYKPLQIQSETRAIRHSLTDIRFQVQEEVSNLYVNLYSQQETIAFYENRLTDVNRTLEKNRARLLAGEAYQADVDSLSKKAGELETKLAAEMRTFESDKSRMTDLTGLDVTSGYRFVNPYVDTKLERGLLESITQHTLENDHELYEAKLDEAAGLATLNSNYGLMRNQYGAKMNRIDAFINQVKRGEKPDTDTFKRQYDALLEDVDSPWRGKFRILFFRFPREWLKGQISGVRYVEDDPYLLYTNALEYQEAIEGRKQIEKQVKQNVMQGFENLVTARSAYEGMRRQTESLKQEVSRGENQNLLGKLPFEELEELEQELEDAGLDELEALQTYSSQLYSYDRLTCGAITALLRQTELGMADMAGGLSYVTEEAADGACYYIHTIIEDNVFELGVYIPDDYELELTDYELWCDGIRVGERTPIDKTIRHLLLDFEQVDRVFLRFYDGEEFADDCEIDTQAYSGPLTVIGAYPVEKETSQDWGSFTCLVNQATNTISIKLSAGENTETAYYRIQDQNGNSLFHDELREIGEEFTYLSLVEADLEQLRVQLYDGGQRLLAEVHFNPQTMKLEEEE